MFPTFMVNPEAEADLSKSEKRDVSDVARARQGMENAQNPTRQKTESDAFMQSPQSIMATAKMQSVESRYQYSETMSMQLTTKEGDTVSLDFKQLYAQYQSYAQQQSTESGPSGVRYVESKAALDMTSFEEQFAFSVEGDLNEGELNAIFDVFGQVDKLANNFFDGNIEKALSQAMELEIDYGQLQSFQLNLTQTETSAVRYQKSAVTEYASVQDKITSDNPEKLGVNLSDLPEYLQQWQSAVEKLDEQFENAQVVLDEILSSMGAQRFPESFPEIDSRLGWFERVQVFHERLAGYAEQSSGNKDAMPINDISTLPKVSEESKAENNNGSRDGNRENETLERS